MDKKEFFESFVSLLPDNSGHRLDAFRGIQEVFVSLKSDLTDSLRDEFEHIEREALFRVWMFEQICNGRTNEDGIRWPLIVISVSWEILFVNRAYCQLSGLSPTDIQIHAADGTLYSRVYEGADIGRAHGAISRLRAGKGYEHLELYMKHSRQKISWNSYGWVGESLEIRSWVEIHNEDDQRKEHEGLYRGNIMNTTRLIENLHQIAVYGDLSMEDEQKLAWIREFLSIFDFLWNHSELFMEIIDMSTTEKDRIQGYYNTVYAQFLRCSFQEEKNFQDTLSRVHGKSVSRFLETRKIEDVAQDGEHVFHQCNRQPVADVYWRHSVYPNGASGHTKILSVGVLVRKIPKANIFVRMFQNVLKTDCVVRT